MTRPQLNLFDDKGPAAPAGLVYAPGFVGAEEEAALAARIAALPFKPFEFHGFTGNRRTVSFGMHYAFDGSGLREAEAVPDWLLPLRAAAAALAGRAPEAFVHALVIEYAPGAGIGWHRDRPVFGDVVGISLLAPAPLRFRRKLVLSEDEGAGARWERFTLTAEPRSAYLLSGEARHQWEHSIPQLETLRYSVTFRTLREEG
jgi:alkylated DNA repair protein (DNA oxidative demethylase)